MDLLSRQIIKRILKEEVEMDKTLSRILGWYDSWETKLKAYLSTEDMPKSLIFILGLVSFCLQL
jgi:hypothetical protein